MSVLVSSLCTARLGGTDYSIHHLPIEILTEIFGYLPLDDLITCVKTCSCWREVIYSDERLWRKYCLTLTESFPNIAEDRSNGYTWREIFQRHYGSNGIKLLWKQGAFSNPADKHLPDKPFCKFDVDTWGQIFEWELDRS